jgi:hypothetical protein
MFSSSHSLSIENPSQSAMLCVKTMVSRDVGGT